MEGKPAIYLDRIVDKKNFRAFIYGANGEKRLVESWAEFEANMQSGLWFATVEDAIESKICLEASEAEPLMKAKPKLRPKSKPKDVPVEEVEDAEKVIADDDTVFEVTDDFLPTGN